jgi:hypothetical protein
MCVSHEVSTGFCVLDKRNPFFKGLRKMPKCKKGMVSYTFTLQQLKLIQKSIMSILEKTNYM